MRLSWYSDTGVAVFSVWQGGTCTGTFRLRIEDLPRMVETLRRGPAGDPLARPGPDADAVGNPEAAGPATGAVPGVPCDDDMPYAGDPGYDGEWAEYRDAGPPGYEDDPLGQGRTRAMSRRAQSLPPGYADEATAAYGSAERPGRGRHRHASPTAYPEEAPGARFPDGAPFPDGAASPGGASRPDTSTAYLDGSARSAGPGGPPPGYEAGIPARGSHHADAPRARGGYGTPGYGDGPPGYPEDLSRYEDDVPGYPDRRRGYGEGRRRDPGQDRFGEDPLGPA